MSLVKVENGLYGVAVYAQKYAHDWRGPSVTENHATSVKPLIILLSNRSSPSV